MSAKILTSAMIAAYEQYLLEEEKSAVTISKYMRDIRAFSMYCDGNPVDKASVIRYKEKLSKDYAVSSVNSMLSAVNGIFEWTGWHECRVKLRKTQRQMFCVEEKELSRCEYERLLGAARRKNRRLYLVIQTICSTGIRVSELKYITLEAVLKKKAEVYCKGKVRVVFIPNDLCKYLKKYARQQGIEAGEIFITKGRKSVDRSNVWREMKSLCEEAGVKPAKVFPHNLRHLFARTYYAMKKDIAWLADILGHGSIETTRIYTISSGREHARQIEKLGLVI